MVEYITYNKERYPIRIGYYVFQNFQQKTGKSFNQAQAEIEKTGDLSMYETVLWLALQSGAKATQQELKLKQEDMIDVLDECLFEFIGLIPKFLPQEGDVNRNVLPVKKSRGQRRAAERKNKK